MPAPDTISQLADEWIIDIRSGMAPKSLPTYRGAVRSYVSHAGDELLGLTKRSVAKWLTWLAETDHNETGRRVKFGGMNLFCKWLITQDLITDNPMDGMSRLRARAVPVVPYSPEDIDKLLATWSSRTFTDRRDEAILLCSPVRSCG